MGNGMETSISPLIGGRTFVWARQSFVLFIPVVDQSAKAQLCWPRSLPKNVLLFSYWQKWWCISSYVGERDRGENCCDKYSEKFTRMKRSRIRSKEGKWRMGRRKGLGETRSTTKEARNWGCKPCSKQVFISITEYSMDWDLIYICH